MSEENTQEIENTETPEREPFDLEEAMGGDKRFEGMQGGEEEEIEEEEELPEGEENPEEEEKSTVEDKYAVTINGEEREFTLGELKTLASKGEGADKKFAEAAEGRRKLEDIFVALKNDPISVLKKMNLDTRKLAEDYLYSEYEIENMSPEQKEMHQFKKDKAEFERAKAEEAQKAESDRLAAQTQTAKEQYELDFSKALEDKGIPKTPDTIRRMASYTERAIADGLEVPSSDIANLVAEDLVNENKKIYENMSAEDVERMFGKGFLKKVKNAELSKIKSPEDKNKATTKNTPKPRKKAPKYQKLSDVFSDIQSHL